MKVFVFYEGLCGVFNISSVNVFISAILLKDDIDRFRVPPFKLSYIRNTTHPSHKKIKLFRDVHYVWWGYQ